MAIHMDQLPKTKPEGQSEGFALPEPGLHGALIEDTQVKISTNGSGNKYIEMVLKLDMGAKVWDNIMESDKAALQYKLGRLITACKLPLVGSLELEDLARVIKGKRIGVDIAVKDETYKGVTKPKASVEIFAGDIFYTPEELDAIKGAAGETAPAPTTPSGSY